MSVRFDADYIVSSVVPVLSESITLWIKKIIPHLLLAYIIFVPSLVVAILLNSFGTFSVSMIRVTIFVEQFFYQFCMYLATAAVIYSAMQGLRGKKASMGEAISKGLGLIVPLAIISVAFAFLSSFVAFVYAIGSLAFAIIFWFFIPVLLFENSNIVVALKRSLELAKDRIVPIVVLWVVYLLATTGASYAVGIVTTIIPVGSIPLVGPAISEAATHAVYALTVTLIGALLAVGYSRLVEGKDNAAAEA